MILFRLFLAAVALAFTSPFVSAQCGSGDCRPAPAAVQRYLLTTGVSPFNGGSISVFPPSPDGYYDAGTIVYLSPTANPGFTFTAFSGDATGNEFPVPVTMNAPRTVIATFQQVGGPPVINGAHFVASLPCRVVDTRVGQEFRGALGPPSIGAGQTRSFVITAAGCSVPTTAVAYSLNVTVVPANTLGFLTLWAAGQPQPNVSTLNAFNGGVVSNAAIVPAGTGGAISVYATDNTDVIIDINGYYDSTTTTGLSFYPLVPCRIADTRSPTGTFGGPDLTGGQSRDFYPTLSNCNIPSTAQAFATNVTVVPEEPLSYLTLWPTGQVRPGVSTLNSFDGRVVANAAVVPTSLNGGISVYSTNNTQFILDANGYFAPPGNTGALTFYSVQPCRVVDTRNANGPLGGPAITGGTSRDFPLLNSTCGIPAAAKAYSLNVTVLPNGPLSFLTIWPTGQPQPGVSTLNSDGRVVANAAIVPAGASGLVSVYVTNTSHVVLDINGYFAP